MACLVVLGSLLSVNAAEVAMAAEGETGQQLAQRVRSIVPTENSEIRGRLEINANKSRRIVPVTCSVVVQPNGTWETIYTAMKESGAERLVIRHSINGPNRYFYAKSASSAASLPTPTEVLASKASSIAFGGSDFSAAELGLEFLHWPQQERLKNQTRLGQPCYVLESVNENEPEIIRVRSFIDQESPGLLVAEGYDHKRVRNTDLKTPKASDRPQEGKDTPVKEFSLHGSSFKKVNGQYRLEKMEIINNKTDSETTLRFELNSNPQQ